MSKSNRVSLHGNRAFLTDDGMLTGKDGVGTGGFNVPFVAIPGSHAVTAVFDDFYIAKTTDTGNVGLSFIRKTGDTGAAGAITAGTNGIYRFSPLGSNATHTVAGSMNGVFGPSLAWKVNQGKAAHAGSLRMTARVKKSVFTGGEHGLFVGFHDAVAAEMPFFDTGGTADKAVATNGFGIMWNVSGDTGWVGVAADGDTYQETVLQATTPTDNTYVVLEMEAHRGAGDTGGTVSFFIDGNPKGSIDNPCNTSTPLVPCVAYYDTGGAATVDIDYIGVSAPRDTGT